MLGFAWRKAKQSLGGGRSPERAEGPALSLSTIPLEMNLVQRSKRSLLHRVLPLPVQGRHVEYSVIASADDDGARPTAELVALALKAIEAAQTISLTAIQARTRSPIDCLNLWPGEGYRLLAGVVQVVQPRLVVEIGTGAGGSALAMKQTLPPDGRIETFDIVDPRTIEEYVLRESDFTDGRLVQHLEDLSQPPTLARHGALLEDADLIYLDAAKDGVVEPRLLSAFERLAFRKRLLLVLDDTRVWNMVRLWRDIRRPKLDLTSFGHWTGTGLVEWSAHSSVG